MPRFPFIPRNERFFDLFEESAAPDEAEAHEAPAEDGDAEQTRTE